MSFEHDHDAASRVTIPEHMVFVLVYNRLYRRAVVDIVSVS